MIHLSLPYPVSVNAMYANAPGRGRIKTERYKTWLNAAGWALKSARPSKVSGAYTLEITLFQSDKRKRDIDNVFGSTKALRDGVSDALGINDAYWDPIVIQWGEYRKHGLVIVELERAAS